MDCSIRFNPQRIKQGTYVGSYPGHDAPQTRTVDIELKIDISEKEFWREGIEEEDDDEEVFSNTRGKIESVIPRYWKTLRISLYDIWSVNNNSKGDDVSLS